MRIDLKDREGEGRKKGRREGGREWERHWLVASCMHPDWRSNPQHFGVQDHVPTNWAAWPGQLCSFRLLFIVLVLVCEGCLSHKPGGLWRQDLLCHSSGDCKSEIKVRHGWFLLEAPREDLFHASLLAPLLAVVNNTCVLWPLSHGSLPLLVSVSVPKHSSS